MITLDNFESFVPYRILMRGVEYYESGTVSDLNEEDSGKWTANVNGTEIYQVEISMEGNAVQSWYCDCPYDGEICKHVVATLFAIRNEQKKVNRSVFSMVKEEDVKVIPSIGSQIDYSLLDKMDLRQQLSLVPSEELSQFVYEYAFTHKGFKTTLLKQVIAKNLNLSGIGSNFRLEIREAFNITFGSGRSHRYNRSDDFIYDWETIFGKVDNYLEQADILLGVGNLDGTIAIALQILRSIGEGYDDELLYNDNVNVWDYCERAGELINQVVEHPNVSSKQIDDILQELPQIAGLSVYRDYDIYDMDELLMRVNLVTQSASTALELIDSILEERKNSCGLYEWVLRKVDLLVKQNETEKAEATIRQYLYLPQIRQQEVEKLLSNRQFDEALCLLDEGMELALREDTFKSASSWMESKMKIYEMIGNIPAMIETCRQLFIYNNGSLEYYHKLKALIPAAQWRKFLLKMMGETAFRHYYDYVEAEIYVEEKDYERLFSLLMSIEYNSLEVLMKYAHYLKDTHSEELIALYTSYLLEYAEQKMGRTHYEFIASVLPCIQKLEGGKEVVKQLVEEFRIKYKRRPAMMEVLRNF